jgi:hypothetical protein
LKVVRVVRVWAKDDLLSANAKTTVARIERTSFDRCISVLAIRPHGIRRVDFSQGFVPKQIEKHAPICVNARLSTTRLASLRPAGQNGPMKSTDLTRDEVDKLLGLALGGGAKAVFDFAAVERPP